jgi:hypothetical protein
VEPHALAHAREVVPEDVEETDHDEDEREGEEEQPKRERAGERRADRTRVAVDELERGVDRGVLGARALEALVVLVAPEAGSLDPIVDAAVRRVVAVAGCRRDSDRILGPGLDEAPVPGVGSGGRIEVFVGQVTTLAFIDAYSSSLRVPASCSFLSFSSSSAAE